MSGRRAKRARRNDAERRAAELRAAAQPTGNADPRHLGGSMTGPGGPHDQGGLIIDTTDVVLLDEADVCTVGMVRRGTDQGEGVYLQLGGQINRTSRRTQVGFVTDTDGAAMLIAELLAIADRHGADLLRDLTRRLVALHRRKNVNLVWLRAAIDAAVDAQGGETDG